MVEMLDNRFSSTPTATKISVLTTMYKKRLKVKYHVMPIYVDEFENFYAQLERMDTNTKIPESHKTLLVPDSIYKNSKYQRYR